MAEEAANHMEKFLSTKYAAYITGPAEPVVGRIRNQYIMEILLKLPKDGAMISQCKKDIQHYTVAIQSNKIYRMVNIIPDVDKV